MQDTPVDATRKYARGLVWPADKATVIEVFERNGAPPDVVAAIRDADKPRWVAPSDVTNTLWKVA